MFVKGFFCKENLPVGINKVILTLVSTSTIKCFSTTDSKTLTRIFESVVEKHCLVLISLKPFFLLVCERNVKKVKHFSETCCVPNYHNDTPQQP